MQAGILWTGARPIGRARPRHRATRVQIAVKPACNAPLFIVFINRCAENNTCKSFEFFSVLIL